MTVQSLDRGIALLHALAEAGQDGLRLIDLQRGTGFSKPTVHRLLTTLKRHAFVAQTDNSKRYCLGPEIAVLGWSGTRQLYNFKDLCDEDMAALASSTGDTSFLVVRSGYETICIDRQAGPYPVKAFTVDVGARRPLGIGATGIALLAALPSAQVEDALGALEPSLKQYPVSAQKIAVAVAAARRSGYALSDGTVLKGVRGLAMSIKDPNGKAVAAIGIAAISERISESRIPQLMRVLRSRVENIERRLVAATGTRTRRRVWRGRP